MTTPKWQSELACRAQLWLKTSGTILEQRLCKDFFKISKKESLLDAITEPSILKD